MQNDIVKRTPTAPEVIAPNKTEIKSDEVKPADASVSPKAAEVAPMDSEASVKTQTVPNASPLPVNDEIKPGEKPQKEKEKNKETPKKVELQQPAPIKQPTGPAIAVVSAIIICLILISLVVYSQMSKS